MKKLDNRAAIVTGGGSGIGRATCLALAAKGSRVLVADLDADRADAVAAEIQDHGGTAAGMPCDVACPEDIETMRDFALREFDRLDVIVNNAGVHAHGLPQDIPYAEWERVWKVNVMSVVSTIRILLPTFLEQEAGHIVNVASINGLYPYTYDRLPYTASKAAVVAMSEALAMYVRPRGVGVSCVCPAAVANTNIRELMPFFGARRVPQESGLPPIEPSDVANLIIGAIESDTFLVMTHDELWDLMRRRVEDNEGLLQEQTAKLAERDAEYGQL
jgi:NAD(P)-dependent dehydrogenase (short-subunit alcohol dehydrogenase family)